MNRRLWFYAVLILSLAVNAGVALVFGLERCRTSRVEEEMVRTRFRDRAALKEMDRLLAANQARQESLWIAESRSRRRLGTLGLEPAPDTAAVSSTLDQLEQTSRNYWQRRAELERAFSRLLKPEAHARWVEDERRWADSVKARAEEGQ